jgi:hypothetical protein
MAWTAPKIQAMLLHTAAPKLAEPPKLRLSSPPSRQPSPRAAGSQEHTSYGGR